MYKIESMDHPLHFLMPARVQSKEGRRKILLICLRSLLPVGQRGQRTFLHLDILTSMINFYCSTM